MAQQMTVEQAQAIVTRYESTERSVEDEYQERRVAAFNAMANTTGKRGPDSAPAQAYRALMIEQSETFKARVADISDSYPIAFAIVREQEAAEARGQLADTIGLAERIAYGDR